MISRFGFKVQAKDKRLSKVSLLNPERLVSVYSVFEAGKPCSPGPAEIVFPGDRTDEPEDAQ
jgi:hypothetical protein